MELYLVIAIVAIIVMAVVGYFVGNRGKKGYVLTIGNLENNIKDLGDKIAGKESELAEKVNAIMTLTSERDVQKTNADNYFNQLGVQKEDYEQKIVTLKSESAQALQHEAERGQRQLNDQKAAYEQQMTDQKATFESQIQELKDTFARQMEDFKAEAEKNLRKQEAVAEEFKQGETKRNAEAIAEIKGTYERQIETMRTSFEQQLKQTKEAHQKQIDALKEMNEEQVKNQLDLIKEQMQTTSEKVLKLRQDELEVQNKEQVSKIIDPLQKSLKDMQDALDRTKSQQTEALNRLDQTIQDNMKKSVAIGETADRLTRALTGEVKVQGNFGELKLKQLLEDMELREGEQYDTQETLRDQGGRSAKGDDGKGLIPDFILHFPNNRHVVVDSKMSLTAYERYMNADDDDPEKSEHLKAHIDSVRAQVKRLAKKEYTKYLPDGYNKLNFAIMYVPIEGALNLAVFNDHTLWKEAYDQGVMILGPQTMYMNLRVLEMMWTQVRQLKNQQAMMNAANTVIERVQDFGQRFMDVESSVNDTVKKITKLKITTADSGQSIITAARNLLKAGAQENKKKKSLAEMDGTMFIEGDPTIMITSGPSIDPVDVTEETTADATATEGTSTEETTNEQ